MKWPWTCPRKKPPTEAQLALQRAQAALLDAEQNLVDLQVETAIVHDERKRNHFGPVIFEGMKAGGRRT